MVVPYFLHLPRSHNETRDRFTSITCFISLFYFLKPDENCSARQVLEDMHKCLDTLELSYVDETMGLLIMLSRAMGSSSKATHKLSKATTSWRPGKLLPATPLTRALLLVRPGRQGGCSSRLQPSAGHHFVTLQAQIQLQ